MFQSQAFLFGSLLVSIITLIFALALGCLLRAALSYLAERKSFSTAEYESYLGLVPFFYGLFFIVCVLSTTVCGLSGKNLFYGIYTAAAFVFLGLSLYTVRSANKLALLKAQ